MQIKDFKQVKKVLESENREIREDVQEILELLELGVSVGMPHVRPLFSIRPGLFEIRVKDRNGKFKIIYFVKKVEAIYLIHAFRKKTEALPKKEKEIILQRLKEVE